MTGNMDWDRLATQSLPQLSSTFASTDRPLPWTNLTTSTVANGAGRSAATAINTTTPNPISTTTALAAGSPFWTTSGTTTAAAAAAPWNAFSSRAQSLLGPDAASLLDPQSTAMTKGGGRTRSTNTHHRWASASEETNEVIKNVGSSRMTLEQRLAQMEQDMERKILIRAVEQTRQKTDALIEEQFAQAWIDERNAYLEGLLGKSIQPRSTTPSNRQQAALIQTLIPLQPITKIPRSVGRAAATEPDGDTATGIRTRIYGAVEDAIVKGHAGMLQTKAHVDILKRTDGKDVSILIKEMIRWLESSTPTSSISTVATVPPSWSGYRSAWRWLQHVAAATSTSTASARTVSSVQQQMQATLQHLTQEFESSMIQRVRQAMMAGQDVSISPQLSESLPNHELVNLCASYIQLTLKSPLGTTSSSSSPPWPILYHCLRCGDAVAALMVLRHSVLERRMATVDNAVLEVLQVFADHQGPDRQSLWEVSSGTVSSRDFRGGSINWPRIPTDARQTIRDLMEHAKQAYQQHQHQPSSLSTTTTAHHESRIHELAVYTLLCADDFLPTSESTPGLNTIEDYLFGALWNCLCSANQKEEQELIELAGVVADRLGPAYFSDDTSEGWSFALPLLAVQQYERALVHLAQSGHGTGNMSLLQATHLALALHRVGIPLHNRQESSNSLALSFPQVSLNRNTAARSDELLCQLLLSYAASLQHLPDESSNAYDTIKNQSKIMALEYLVRIPNKFTARTEVAKFIARTGALQDLVGALNSEGMRQPGSPLERHFGDTDIETILGDAATYVLQESTTQHDRSINIQAAGTAVMCFMLAGRYADVLTLLNRWISPANEPDTNRAFWIGETKSFHATFLQKRTHVLDVLERDPASLQLIDTSRTLLHLNALFEAYRQGRGEDAWSLVSALTMSSNHPASSLSLSSPRNQQDNLILLLPSSRSDVFAQEEIMRHLDPLLRQVYPILLVTAMEMLYQEYRRVQQQQQQILQRRNSSATTPGAAAGTDPAMAVTQERLHQLKQQARYYTNVAGMMVDATPDWLDRFTRLSSLMM